MNLPGKNLNLKTKERRKYMVEQFKLSGSKKMAIDVTSRKFDVPKESLYVDWSRRKKWLPLLVMDFEDKENLIQQLFVQIKYILFQVEKLANDADNDNCRLGAYRTQLSSLFKMIEFFQNDETAELRKRIEALEKTVGNGVVIP